MPGLNKSIGTTRLLGSKRLRSLLPFAADRAETQRATLSLNFRLLIVASVVLCAFLGLTGWALDRAFRQSARAAVQEHLQIYIYSLLAVAELDSTDGLVFPDELPEGRFSSPSSGLYAAVTQSGNLMIWRSRSMVGLTIPLPPVPKAGNADFREIHTADGAAYFVMGFSVSWESSPGALQGYTFYVAESQAEYLALVGRFRRELWGMLGAATFFLLLAQAAVLRWGLAPLRRVAFEIADIETGQREQLTEHYPSELHLLTRRLNALIKQRGEHLNRYRNALGDLAHSLKTPLAVMRGALADDSQGADNESLLQEQMQILDQTIEYQLQRAAASGRTVLKEAVLLEEVAARVIRSLRKVYAEKSFEVVVNIEEKASFPGDEGDLTEILGILLDNACRWAQGQVAISAQVIQPLTAEYDRWLTIAVEDDGPGFLEDWRQPLSARGQRVNSPKGGHGIGLAVVRELVTEVYKGELELTDSLRLGGAAVRLRVRL
jgi:two-component system, OmpR family, sensor histidine kinase PhoQ